jgi:DNA-3-methyladenine glycosylase II
MDKKISDHFKKVDNVLYKASLKIELPVLVRANDYFVDLIETIIGQQLSGKAADTIFGRFKNLMPDGLVTPENILKIGDEKIREAGMSYSKIKYIKGVSHEVLNNGLDLKKFDQESDEIVREELIKLKGIGPWSAEMFLMFSLGREDIFSPGDQGLKNAIKKLYGFNNEPTEKEMLEISIKWKPYRTYASRILWKSLD